MKNTLKGLLALAAVVAVSLIVSQQTQELQPASTRLLAYATTSTRTTNVNNLCAANLDRSTLVNQADLAAAASARASVDSELGIDGYIIFYSAIR